MSSEELENTVYIAADAVFFRLRDTCAQQWSVLGYGNGGQFYTQIGADLLARASADPIVRTQAEIIAKGAQANGEYEAAMTALTTHYVQMLRQPAATRGGDTGVSSPTR